MNDSIFAADFRWFSALGSSVFLFLISGILHVLIGSATPFAMDTEFARKILMISNRTDAAFFGGDPAQLIETNTELARLRMVLAPVMGGWLSTIGILLIAVTWFGLRHQQIWALWVLSLCGVIIAVSWMFTLRPYVQAGIQLTLSDLPPIFWVPAVTLLPAFVLGWIGLK